MNEPIFDFSLELNAEGVGEVTEAELFDEADRRLRELARGNRDLTGAAITIRQPAHGETPYLYEARVVVYARPEPVVATELKDHATTALKGALDAVERQVRNQREKLGKLWELPGNDPVTQEVIEVEAAEAVAFSPEESGTIAPDLSGKRVAILVENGFEQEELTRPRAVLEEAGAQTDIISPAGDKVKGWNHGEWGDSFNVDVRLTYANPDDYDALLLPGGVMNPDKLRRNEEALYFIRAFFEAGKPVAAICHGPWTLVDAGVVRGRTLTSYSSIQTDLKNAGAEWVNQEVVVDNGLVTSRKPDDIPAFNRHMVETFAEGRHKS
jgi:protease I